MRRVASTVSVGCLATARRRLRDRGREGLDKEDPFGEKAGWDADNKYAKWHGINLDAMTEALESPEVQRTHFGPDWARLSTVTRHAGRKAKAAAPQGEDSDYAPSTKRVDGEGQFISATALSSKWTTKQLNNMPQTYEQLVASGAVDDGAQAVFVAPNEAAPEEAEVAEPIPVSIHPKSNFEREVPAYVASAAAAAVEPPAAAQASSTLAAEPSETPVAAAAPPAATEAAAEAVPAAAAEPQSAAGVASWEAAGISPKEPLEWTCTDVVNFLRHYANIDDDMAAAFEMVNVDGSMLLNKIFPPNMFKEMRRWHNRGRKAPPAISEELVQETVYLSYPYGR